MVGGPRRGAGAAPAPAGLPAGAPVRRCAWTEGCVVKTSSCGRLPADPDPPHPRVPVRRPLVRGFGPARPEEAADRGQDRALRVRHRPRHRAADPFPGPLLPDRHDLHHLRHRDRLPLPVGGDLPPAGLVRPGRGGGLRRRGVRLLPLPGEQRRPDLGPVQAVGRWPCRPGPPSRPSPASLPDRGVPAGRRRVGTGSASSGRSRRPDDREPATAPTGPGRAA